jgi:hypothetical protein
MTTWVPSFFALICVTTVINMLGKHEWEGVGVGAVSQRREWDRMYHLIAALMEYVIKIFTFTAEVTVPTEMTHTYW